MKNMIAIALSLCLMMSFALAEEAVEAEKPQINWADMEGAAALFDGVFASVSSTGLKMFVPDSFVDQELTEEQLGSGYFMVLSSESEQMVVNGQMLPISMDLFKQGLENAGATGIEDGVLNGIPCTSYEINGEGYKSIGVAFSNAAGDRVVTLSIAPVTEANSVLAAVMIASIQKIEAE